MRSTKVAAVLVVALCVAGTAAALPTESVRSQQPQQAQQGVSNPNATLVFSEQTTNGSVVRLNTATLSQGGFVAIHDTSLTANNSTVGSVIGVSQRLSPGPHQDVVVPLYAVDGRNFNDSRLAANGTLVAMAHFDSNDNGEFDFVATNGSTDGPYVEGVRAVTDNASISVRPAADDAADGGILGGVGPIAVTLALVVVLALLGGAAVVARRRQ
ncbi:hypothetical protein [Halococcus sp. PRR34]|uniref:DUF7282 domain-containing protein n=1 Tax=Halococcus sp. PRR34 TaxID=3020830 RepID=UPI00235F6F2C|nr:hypothetical protein [Halococcus sp. PRR34]